MIHPPVMALAENRQPNIVLRFLWFIFVGWWLGLIWLHIGFALCASVIFLPFGLLMLNRLPAILTLRSTGDAQMQVVTNAYGQTFVTYGEVPQLNILIRAIWFFPIGLILGYLTSIIGYLLCATIILLPFGILLLDRIPAIMTLRRSS